MTPPMRYEAPTSDYAHVADEGVRNYLTNPPEEDFNVAAAQLRHANLCLLLDGQNQLLPLRLIEGRFEAYEEATTYYGFLNLLGVQKALRKFWLV